MSFLGGMDIMGNAKSLAGRLGEAQAAQVFQQLMKRVAVDVFTERDSRELEGMITNDYPLVEEELSDAQKEKIGEIGPQFEGLIRNELTAEQILAWLANPDWIDNPEVRDELQKCHAIITDHPDGMAWLRTQVRTLRAIALNQSGPQA